MQLFDARAHTVANGESKHAEPHHVAVHAVSDRLAVSSFGTPHPIAVHAISDHLAFGVQRTSYAYRPTNAWQHRRHIAADGYDAADWVADDYR